MIPRPRTLFGKTLATIAFVSAGFLLFALAVLAKFVLLPVGERSAEDLAILMVTSARNWYALDDAAREGFAADLEQSTGLRIRPFRPELPERGMVLPYFYFLESALEARTGAPLTLRTEPDPNGTLRFYAAIEVVGNLIDVGVSRRHIGVQPPLALFLVFSVGLLVAMATAVALVRRITSPLERLSGAARRIGEGDWPAPLPETGPEELAQLSRSFNRMRIQVQELLANRTTLLAGISHDLRTPLSRMQVALEMLPGGEEPELIEALRRDLAHMNSLIGQFLHVARGLGETSAARIDLAGFLRRIGDSMRGSGGVITITPGETCHLEVPELALRRIVENLLENAVRYGRGEPVQVEWHCTGDRVAIHILDRGPGIPEDKLEAVFRPFYRLEGARNLTTGGSGLGLAIARQLAQANGWDIKLLSRYGGGTRAVVNLPLAPSEKVPDTPPPREGVPGSAQ